jgi:hypothetical protein
VDEVTHHELQRLGNSNVFKPECMDPVLHSTMLVSRDFLGKGSFVGRVMTQTLGMILILFVVAAFRNEGAQEFKIRQIDFKNFTYAWDDSRTGVPEEWAWMTTPPQSRVGVSKGIHHFYEQAGYGPRESAPVLRVYDVTYGDLLGDGDEEAVVSLNYSTGGTANWDYVYVYRLKGVQPTLMARMETGSRGYGGLIKASVQKGQLVLDFTDKERAVGDCCSEGYTRVQYRWRGRSFVEVGMRQHGKLELKEGPPTGPVVEGPPEPEQSVFNSDDEKWVRPVRLPEGVLEILRKTSVATPEQMPDDWLLASEIHLGGSTETDLIVMGIRGLRGVHLAPFWVLRKTSAGYELVLSTGGDGLAVSKIQRNGFRMIQVGNLTAVSLSTTIYEFDGHHYTELDSKREPIR